MATVTIKDYMNKTRTIPVAEYIQASCNGSDYDRGAIETAQAAADQTAEVLGRLIDTLCDKGILTKTEVVKLGRGY